MHKPHTAAKPLTSGLFPGWTMLAIAGAAQYMSAPGQSYSVAAFKDPMREGLAISETSFSLAYAFATLLSACLLPFVGRLVDRLGARLMLPVIATGLGLACVYMSQIQTLVGLYVAFCFVRSLGQGALSLVSVWIVGEWFERRRGMATAIAGLGGGLSVMTIPLLNNFLIEDFGWSTAWVVLAIAVWATLIPASWVLRNRPEDLGLRPDGFAIQAPKPRAVSDETRPSPTEESWTVGEVIRDKTFWKLLAVPATSGLVGTGLVFHQVALLGQHGMSSTSALFMLTIQAGFATLMTFPLGWLTDRIASRFILLVAMLVLTLANLLVLAMPFLWLSVVYALLLGVHGSILRSTANVVWINYYGRANQGAVRGVAWSVMILASALGPLPLALSVDQFGTYSPALMGFLMMPLLAACAVATARPNRRPTTATASAPPS